MTRELMPSGPVAESELRVARTFSTFLGAKDTWFRRSCVRLGKVGTESEGVGTQDLEATTELRYSAFSRAKLTVLPFEEREGMEGEHTLETDLTMCHYILEEREISLKTQS